MLSRLVLYCGASDPALARSIARLSGDVTVISDDAGCVTSLRTTDIAAINADPATTDNYPADADVVVIAGDDPQRNLEAARVASQEFPSAYFVGYGRAEADPSQTEFETFVDRVISPTTALVDGVLKAAGGVGGEKTGGLVTALRQVDDPVAVVPHDNPDPDAIASAIGLSRIAEWVGIRAEPCYFGDIQHQENRALVNLLSIDMRSPEDALLEEFGAVALVDHSRPGVNDSLSEATDVSIVVDHHPPRGPVDGTFVDIRPDAGSTSTIIAEYLRTLGIEPSQDLATALLYGIQTDTREFTRQVGPEDFRAAGDLVELVDESILEKVESPQISQETLETLGSAIREREVQGSVLLSCVGRITNRDALAQAAERLLGLENISVALTFGFTETTVYVSARSRGTDTDIGETLREALGKIGSAGGHADMAGAQLPLGILSEMNDADESLTDVVSAVVTDRVFAELEDAPVTPEYDDALTATGASRSMRRDRDLSNDLAEHSPE